MEPEPTILFILFLTCILYAFVLERLHDRYVPNWLVVTVIIGNSLVIEALALMEHYGVELTAWRVFYANLAAGVPIATWQCWQISRRFQEKHSGATPRREADAR